MNILKLIREYKPLAKKRLIRKYQLRAFPIMTSKLILKLHQILYPTQIMESRKVKGKRKEKSLIKISRLISI